MAGQLGQQGGHVLRLDGQQQDVGVLGRIGVADRLDAVLLAELQRPLDPADRDRDVVGTGRPARSSPDSSASPSLPAPRIAILVISG